MTKILTVKYADQKTSQNGDPWLSVKDVDGNYYSVWEQTLFHLFTPGRKVEASIVTKGKFTNIVDVITDSGYVGEAPKDETPKKGNGEKILEALKFIQDQNVEIIKRLDGLEGVNQ